MKKIYFLFTLLTLLSFNTFSQGNENFDGFVSATSSYVDGTFTGQDGSTWTHTQCRGDVAINSNALMIGRNRTPQSETFSGTISGGVGTISFNYMQAFGTNVNLNVLVNDVVVGNVTSTGEANIVKASGVITVNQPGDVVIKFRNVNNSDGQVVIDDVVWTGYTGAAVPNMIISSPSDNAVFSAGTTSVDVSIIVQNFVVGNPGAGIDGHIHWTINGSAQPMKYNVADETITVANGQSYTVFMQLVDNSHTPIVPNVNATVNFSVEYPCDLVLGTITTTCDAVTAGVDTYTTTIDFTGGGTSTYTIDTAGNGTVGGDNPSAVASGQIVITGVNEGTNFTVNVTGNAANSSCNINRNINSPSCVSAACANPGDIIITEIMQNPAINSDPAGEYIEVYNTTGSPIDMSGWIIKDDVTAAESHTIVSLIVPANGYAVIGNVATPNGGVTMNYTYGNDISLGNGLDGLIIECSSTVIDQVIWDGGPAFPDPSGASMELATNKYTAADNDLGENWGTAVSAFGDGDLGTPGSVNDFTLSVNQFETNIFSIYPNPTSTGFVNITSTNVDAMSVAVFDVLGKQVINKTITNNRLDVSSLNAGLYIVKISQNNAIITKKLIIE
jgi:hypothetical protein